jgi:hypothetical protein
MNITIIDFRFRSFEQFVKVCFQLGVMVLVSGPIVCLTQFHVFESFVQVVLATMFSSEAVFG